MKKRIRDFIWKYTPLPFGIYVTTVGVVNWVYGPDPAWSAAFVTGIGIAVILLWLDDE